MKRIMSIMLALLLALSACAFAEQDLQAQLDEALARIEELQAQVDKYYPYYASRVAASFGEDGVIWIEDVQAQYDELDMQYQSMGISISQMGDDVVASVKNDILTSLVADAVLLQKAKELGLDVFSEDELQALRESAEAELHEYLHYYIDYFYPDSEITEELETEAELYWASVGVSVDSLVEEQLRTAAMNAAADYLTEGVVLEEEELLAFYGAKIEEAKAAYTNDSTFYSDYTYGVPCAWIPAGYRAVKQVLIKFDEAQTEKYSELQLKLSELQAELDSAEAGARSEEEIRADIEATEAELQALYDALMPRAQQVTAAFEAGTDFNELIELYGEDPGMMSGTTAVKGYPVSASTTVFDPAFTAAAMSIEEKGGISEPTPGSYGIYIVWYMDDLTPGVVPFEELRDVLYDEALESKLSEVYNEGLNAWIEEMNVQYHPENL